jgi:DNA-binding transcriptional LysR family regulator
MSSLQTSLPALLSAVQAADSGSFTAAAKVLSLTPAAVSKNVAALEAMLHVRLFNRTTRQLSLTDEGRAFVDQARSGLAMLEAATVSATQGLQAQGLVRVNCAVGFGRRYVLPLLPMFYAAHPKVQVELSLNDQSVDLVAEGFDVGIRGGLQPPEGMVARKICDLESALVASPAYLKARGMPKHYTDLASHDLLRLRFHSGRSVPWLFKEKGKIVALDAPAKLLISDPEIIVDAAVLHMGIARTGRLHALEALQKGKLVEVLAKQHHGDSGSIALFYPHRAGMPPRVRVLVEFLWEHLTALPTLKK